MAAEIKVYMDYACTQPLTSLAGQYSVYLGPQIGLDGDAGELWSGVVYMKNSGNQKALFVRAIVGNDEFHYVSISTDGLSYQSSSYVELPIGAGDHALEIGSVYPLHVRLHVPPGTEAAQWNPNISISFKTLP